MIKQKPYDLVDPIIPFPKDEWRRDMEYNLFNIITFHELSIELKNDLEWEMDTNKISEEELFNEIIKGEKIENDEKVMVCSTFDGCYEIEKTQLKKFFVEEIYDRGFNDYFFIFPKSKLILTLDHHSKIGRCDFGNFKPKKAFYSQFRVTRTSSLNRKNYQELANKYRYELLVNEQFISKFRIKRASKDLEKIGLIISDLEETDYPTEKFLLNREQIKAASNILEKHILKFYQKDKQKDKKFLKKIKK